jgi:ACS family sodium-dependent inorganic phosphate cotransporter-like MFS transporter 9
MFVLQGLVLSSFFAGHMLTQILGGYVSDRYGGELSMTVAMVGWSVLTLVTPLLVKPCPENGKIYAFAVLRFITGCVQGQMR